MESRRNVSASKHIPGERLGSGERRHDRDGAFGALPGIGGAIPGMGKDRNQRRGSPRSTRYGSPVRPVRAIVRPIQSLAADVLTFSQPRVRWMPLSKVVQNTIAFLKLAAIE